MKARKILVADLLCGAGGSSTGCKRALDAMGLQMELVCVNHWPVAIETHTKNHPEARHYVQDISAVRPHLIVPEGYLDLLMASPTCTHHSVARGGKPTSDQQRSDPWHIITWLTELRVRRMIIENVWEFVGWGPVDPRTGKPIKTRKGEYFQAWIETIRRLGFEPEWRKLNAADYGDATTRQRFILMARSDRRPVSWPMPTHAKKTLGDLLPLPALQSWRPAREIIDWQIKGRSIFTRKKPLAAKTLARIYAGAIKFQWPEPFLVVLRNHMSAQSLDAPLPTVAANGNHIGVAEPVIMNGRKGNQAKGVSTEPVPTLDTKGGVWLAEPFVLAPGSSGAPREVAEPLPTITTGGAGSERQGCARPMIITVAHGNDSTERDPNYRRSKSVEDPLGAVHGDGNAFALVAPYYGTGSGETCNSASEPLPTVTARGRFGMVVPITHADGHNRAQNVDVPLPVITTANRGELAFVTAQFGERDGQQPRIHDLGEPAPTGLTLGHGGLVEGTQEYDILFRMLEPHELAAAMGFSTEESTYEFAGTKTEQVKQIGNAVSVRKMRACVSSIMADAAPAKAIDPVAMAAE